jgi:hypothetical protein
MLTRREARRRLIARWHSAVAQLPAGREPLFPISHFVTPENVEAVRGLHLYGDHSDERRDRQLVEAWSRRDNGAPRQ